MSTVNQWEKMRNRINRIIGLVPLNGKRLSGLAPELITLACSSPNNSSALPDKLFHPRHWPIILYLFDTKSCSIKTAKMLILKFIYIHFNYHLLPSAKPGTLFHIKNKIQILSTIYSSYTDFVHVYYKIFVKFITSY